MKFLSLTAFALSLTLAAGCSQEPAPEPTSPDSIPPADVENVEAELSGIQGEEITYQVGEVTLTGYLAYDADKKGARPGVLVVHEWWGHNDYVRDRAKQLAAMGYTAFALDMYGDGKFAAHPGDAQKFMMEVMGQADVAQLRFEAAMELLNNHASTNDQMAAIGYCFGGAVVLQMARNGLELAGVASFHGNLATEAPASEGTVNAKVLVLHGAADPFVPAEQVNAFKAEMDAAKVDYEFIAYPGAVHAFTNPGATALGEQFDLPLAYDETVDKQSWAELDKFLTEIF